jgi:DtxR family Mn-dependent transcriptional regulator
MATSAAEDYLKQILLLEQENEEGKRVSTGALAQALGVSPGSVTAMVKQLAEQGLAGYERYAGVELSEEGRRVATGVLRRHRLLELFLVQVVGMDWSEVHDEAERLEHHVSERLLARLDEMLGFPVADPHGDPIPSAEGELEETRSLSLLEAPLDKPHRVVRVADQDQAFLKLLNRIGIALGARVLVSMRDEAADAVLLLVGDDPTPHGLGSRAASKIHVAP